MGNIELAMSDIVKLPESISNNLKTAKTCT